MSWNAKNALYTAGAACARLLGMEEILQGVLNANQDAIRVVGGDAPGSPNATNVTAVQGVGYSASATFNRTNDTNAYTALDAIAETVGTPAAMPFANIGPVGGGKVLLTSLGIRIDASAIPAGMVGFRLHLYSAAPTMIADNAAFSLAAGDRAKYLGFIEVPAPLLMGATLWSETEAMNLPIRKEIVLPQAAAGSVWGILQTLGGFTPVASTPFTLSLNSVLLG